MSKVVKSVMICFLQVPVKDFRENIDMISRLFLFIVSVAMTLYVVVVSATFMATQHENSFYNTLNKDFAALQTSLSKKKTLNTFMASEDIKKYTSQITANEKLKDDSIKPKFQKLLNEQATLFKEKLSEKELTRETGESGKHVLAEYFKEKESNIKNEDLLSYFEKYNETSHRIDNYAAWKSSTFLYYASISTFCIVLFVILILFLSLALQYETIETSIKYLTYGTFIVNSIFYVLVFSIFYFISP